MTTNTQDPRITELLDWQLTTGRPLPMAITAILAHEDAGHVVDLVTGEVTPPDALIWTDDGHLCAGCGGAS